MHWCSFVFHSFLEQMLCSTFVIYSALLEFSTDTMGTVNTLTRVILCNMACRVNACCHIVTVVPGVYKISLQVLFLFVRLVLQCKT